MSDEEFKIRLQSALKDPTILIQLHSIITKSVEATKKNEP